MSKKIKEVPFPTGLADALLVQAQDEEAPARRRQMFDWDKEIPDMEEGYVYARTKKGKKGERLRKLFSPLGGSYNEEAISFWRPKILDLAACERKRWFAVQYRINELRKITGAFDLVLKNTPFSCIRTVPQWPGYAWIKFPKNGNSLHERGVSWNWQDNNTKPVNVPLKQHVGDAWFHYEDRSKLIWKRVGYFETVFKLSLEHHYRHHYNSDYSNHDAIINLQINGRSYIVGRVRDGYSSPFGVIAYPENTRIEIVN